MRIPILPVVISGIFGIFVGQAYLFQMGMKIPVLLQQKIIHTAINPHRQLLAGSLQFGCKFMAIILTLEQIPNLVDLIKISLWQLENPMASRVTRCGAEHFWMTHGEHDRSIAAHGEGTTPEKAPCHQE